ncbi:MAG: phosphatidate cytidylyltransferase [Bacteroidia bacterium]|nr:phosphatidate cytidylyltransferase [Bacteroidia bacterium]
MKNSTLTLFIPTLCYALLLSSCSAIAGIFKAGMGFGIFIVVAVIALIIFFISRAGK